MSDERDIETVRVYIELSVPRGRAHQVGEALFDFLAEGPWREDHPLERLIESVDNFNWETLP